MEAVVVQGKLAAVPGDAGRAGRSLVGGNRSIEQPGLAHYRARAADSILLARPSRPRSCSTIEGLPARFAMFP